MINEPPQTWCAAPVATHINLNVCTLALMLIHSAEDPQSYSQNEFMMSFHPLVY